MYTGVPLARGHKSALVKSAMKIRYFSAPPKRHKRGFPARFEAGGGDNHSSQPLCSSALQCTLQTAAVYPSTLSTIGIHLPSMYTQPSCPYPTHEPSIMMKLQSDLRSCTSITVSQCDKHQNVWWRGFHGATVMMLFVYLLLRPLF